MDHQLTKEEWVDMFKQIGLTEDQRVIASIRKKIMIGLTKSAPFAIQGWPWLI